MPNLLALVLRPLGRLVDAAEDALDVWEDPLTDDMSASVVDWPGQVSDGRCGRLT